MLLKAKYPQDEKFTISKFWGPATINSQVIEHGFKMKWHNVGSGKVQLRLAVAIIQKKAVLCQGYVKTDEKTDKREMLKFKMRIQRILEKNYKVVGDL
jgi:hypothetical protein